jgi:ABC-type amino acid transport substrate-binding protein
MLPPLVRYRGCAIVLRMSWPSAAEQIRIAYNNLLPPFTELRVGSAAGLVIDIVRAAAEYAGYEVEFVPIALDQMEAALSDGRAAAVIPLAASTERRDRLDFSQTVLTTGGALFVRQPEQTPASLQALAGRTVVTPRSGPLAAYIQKIAPDVKLIRTMSYQASLARLVDGEADAAALNYQAGASIAGQLYPGRLTIPRSTFLELPLAAAVLKGQNAEFLARLNAGLAAVRVDGTWDRINESWMPR